MSLNRLKALAGISKIIMMAGIGRRFRDPSKASDNVLLDNLSIKLLQFHDAVLVRIRRCRG